eukprot:2035222-Amphidinium_carterae.4
MNHDLRDVIGKDAKMREDAHKSAKEFMNDNADNGILLKHCETKVTRAIGEKHAALYAKFTYVMGIAVKQDLERLFDTVDQEASGDESQEQGGFTGKTTPEKGEQLYPSKYVKKYPPEVILTQQTVEVYGNGSPNQYMGRIPNADMTPWMRRFT